MKPSAALDRVLGVIEDHITRNVRVLRAQHKYQATFQPPELFFLPATIWTSLNLSSSK
jgi:hypothetical protein